MEIKVEMLEDNNAKIAVVVPAADVDRHVNKLYKEAAKKYTFPGFRKGKAPRAVIDAAFGAEYVCAQATDEVINENTPVAIDESGLFVVGEPNFGEEAVQLVKPGSDYEFEFTVALRAEIEISSYEPVEVEVPAMDTSEAEIDFNIEMTVAQFANWEDAGEHAKAADGNRIVIDMQATDDKGEDLATLNVSAFQYTIGSGLFPAAFDEAVTGCTPGDTIEFSCPLGETPTTYTTPYMGQTEAINFKLEVKGVKVKMNPEVTDEWVEENIGFESVQELREQISASLNKQKADNIPAIKENGCLNALVARFEGDAPANMCEEQEVYLRQEFFKQLQRNGQTYDMYLKNQGITKEQLDEDLKHQASDIVKQNLGLDAWARHAELTVSEGEIEAEFIKAQPDNWEDLYNNWKKAGQLHIIREDVLRRKALDLIVETAVVKEIVFEAPEA